MPEKSGIDFMIAFVEGYLDGKLDRLDWDLDFTHHIIQQFHKMERENSDVAECFSFYLSEQGFDKGISLLNDAHRAWIRRQFDEFKTALQSELF